MGATAYPYYRYCSFKTRRKSNCMVCYDNISSSWISRRQRVCLGANDTCAAIIRLRTVCPGVDTPGYQAVTPTAFGACVDEKCLH